MFCTPRRAATKRVTDDADLIAKHETAQVPAGGSWETACAARGGRLEVRVCDVMH